ncbi:MAG: hypothetical protein J7576_23960, partial [Siphonobacter aquaeclarae]|nr:hypothetical protein [Siphonobacter aquaeclarae]
TIPDRPGAQQEGDRQAVFPKRLFSFLSIINKKSLRQGVAEGFQRERLRSVLPHHPGILAAAAL